MVCKNIIIYIIIITANSILLEPAVFTTKELAVILISTANNGANEMNNSNQSKSVDTKFDILEKLKSTGAHWAYRRAAQPYQEGYNYEFTTVMHGEMEFAIYERQDNNYVLVDFFKNYDEACPYAKKIIDEHPDIKNIHFNRTIN